LPPLVILVLGSFAWSLKEGQSIARRRAEAFNVLVFAEIGYAVTTRFIKDSTFNLRALVCSRSSGLSTPAGCGGAAAATAPRFLAASSSVLLTNMWCVAVCVLCSAAWQQVVLRQHLRHNGAAGVPHLLPRWVG
jgi:hypothetical protein